MDGMSLPVIVPVSSEPARTSSTLKEIAVAVTIVLAVIVAGWFITQRFVIEPGQQKAAFVEVVGSTDAQLRAKPLDELIDLKSKVFNFSVRTPSMMISGADAQARIDEAIAAKHAGQ